LDHQSQQGRKKCNAKWLVHDEGSTSKCLIAAAIVGVYHRRNDIVQTHALAHVYILAFLMNGFHDEAFLSITSHHDQRSGVAQIAGRPEAGGKHCPGAGLLGHGHAY
jgi:hypothetical protein